MKTFCVLFAMLGLIFGAANVSAAPATASHPIVKQIVGYLINNPADKEKKVADAIEDFLIENNQSALPSKGLARAIIIGTNGAPPYGMTKKEYCTRVVLLYLR